MWLQKGYASALISFFSKNFFFNVHHLKSLYFICYNVASLLGLCELTFSGF